MKIKFAVIFSLLCSFSLMATCQLSNTKWKGTITTTRAIDILWAFSADTLQVFTLPDSNLIEKMSYTLEPGFLLVKKVSGTTPCDESTVGKYKFEVKDDKLFISVVDDDCQARGASVSTDPYIKVE